MAAISQKYEKQENVEIIAKQSKPTKNQKKKYCTFCQNYPNLKIVIM